jgi:hypothetical protein
MTRGLRMAAAVVIPWVLPTLMAVAEVRAHDPVEIVAGVWQGVLTGPPYRLTSRRVHEVRLTLRRDHTWTLVTAEWHATGRVEARGRDLLLEGDVIANDSPTVRLGPARFALRLRGDRTLVGSGIPQFLGEDIVTTVHVVKAAPGEGRRPEAVRRAS